jgi:hypothetical protein
VQGALIASAVRYWLVSIAAIGVFTMLGWLFICPGVAGFVGSGAPMATILPVFVMGLLASLLMLPFVIYDMMRLSNRFAGPMYRLHRSMEQLASGAAVETIRFREGDFWQEFADTFNKLAAKVESERQHHPEYEYDLAPLGTSECVLPTCGAESTLKSV